MSSKSSAFERWSEWWLLAQAWLLQLIAFALLLATLVGATSQFAGGSPLALLSGPQVKLDLGAIVRNRIIGISMSAEQRFPRGPASKVACVYAALDPLIRTIRPHMGLRKYQNRFSSRCRRAFQICPTSLYLSSRCQRSRPSSSALLWCRGASRIACPGLG